MLILLIRVERLLGRFPLILSFANEFVVNKVKCVLVLVMTSLDLLICTCGVVLSL